MMKQHDNKIIMNDKQKPENTSEAQLQELLQEYNKIDKRKLGSIKLSDALKLLKQTSNIQLMNEEILERIVFNTEKFVTFDEFLALKYQAQLDTGVHKDTTNFKMISFLKLLEDYRKKCEQSSLYLQAQKANQKIQEIKQKEMKRHKHKLLLQQKSKVLSVNSIQQTKLVQFNTAWNDYMEKYEDAAINSIEKLKAKHLREIQQEQERVRNYYQNYLKPSKKLLDLRSRQKTLVKQKQYIEAEKVKNFIHKIEAKQRNSKTVQITERIKKRKQILQKHQQAALLAHLKRIQKDRNEQIKQRQLDSQKMLIKLKNIQNDIVQKQSVEIRQTLQNLRETMCLSTAMFHSKKQQRAKSLEKINQSMVAKQQQKSFKIRVNSFQKHNVDTSLYNP